MAGRDEMQRKIDEMLLEIECHSEDAVSLLKKSNITPKQSGFLCENIFVIDFSTKSDFDKGIIIMHQLQNSNDAIIEVKTFGKTKRITLHF